MLVPPVQLPPQLPGPHQAQVHRHTRQHHHQQKKDQPTDCDRDHLWPCKQGFLCDGDALLDPHMDTVWVLNVIIGAPDPLEGLVEGWVFLKALHEQQQ